MELPRRVAATWRTPGQDARRAPGRIRGAPDRDQGQQGRAAARAAAASRRPSARLCLGDSGRAAGIRLGRGGVGYRQWRPTHQRLALRVRAGAGSKRGCAGRGRDRASASRRLQIALSGARANKVGSQNARQHSSLVARPSQRCVYRPLRKIIREDRPKFPGASLAVRQRRNAWLRSAAMRQLPELPVKMPLTTS